MSPCSVNGARSEVPETLPPTVPLKSERPSAVPYSVIEVPKIGISEVALYAACNAAVAFAIIKSTFLETNAFAIVVHAVESPAAFCTSISTFSAPSNDFNASSKPCVAASSAKCCVS